MSDIENGGPDMAPIPPNTYVAPRSAPGFAGALPSVGGLGALRGPHVNRAFQ
jgi:hypothetical protein